MSEPLSHVTDHIELIAKHEQDFLARRTHAERLGDVLGSFIGSPTFVCLHLCGFVLWILANVLHLPHVRHFDPFPFPLLGTLVAMEAIFLASIILMRQSRMGRRSDERDHLILQVLLLTEKEITAVLGMERDIAGAVGLKEVAKDVGIEQLSRETSIDEVAQTLQEHLPTE